MNDDVDSPIPITPRGRRKGGGSRGNGAEVPENGARHGWGARPLWDRIASEPVAPPRIEAPAWETREPVAPARIEAPAWETREPVAPARIEAPAWETREPVAPPRIEASAAEAQEETKPVRADGIVTKPRGRVAQPRPVRALSLLRDASRGNRLAPPIGGPRESGGDGGRAGGGNGRRTGDGDDGPPSGPAVRPPKPRLRKLRLLAILSGLAVLALVSFVFGVLMSVASDIPLIENSRQYQHQQNSYLYDDQGHLIGVLDPPTHNVIVGYPDISKWVRRAVVAVEDKRFWSEPGIDLRGVLRAIVADATGSATQGASTITEQFVKNALQEQGNRTVFEKLREAALAFHLSHRWSKPKILTEYLNSIYFGNGAYGVESAARVYFGKQLGYDPYAATDGKPGGCGNKPGSYCASDLDPAQAALLAGMIASPGQFNPLANPAAAEARRDVVLKDMLSQGLISRWRYNQARKEPLPTATDIEQPQEPPVAPYFTSWVEPQIIAALEHEGLSQTAAEYRAYYGGLKIKTTLDLSLQRAADQAVQQVLPYGPGDPAASLVAIDNHTGEVRAMVGGPIINGHEDYTQYPFNLATQGHRQPGSAFKPFTLAVALERGIGPDSEWVSAPQDFIVPNSGGKEHFIVHNFGNQYSGVTTLQSATDYSDNSVFAQVGIKVGTTNVADMARNMGIRTPVSNNYAMILGAMRDGPTVLDMAHAYETFATGGLKVYNPILGDNDPQLGNWGHGPIGIHAIDCPGCGGDLVNHPTYARILPVPIAQEVQTMLEGPVQQGTATAAAIPGVAVSGKTGTTTNYADAWFVGWTPQLTVAVWVGFPNKLVEMNTLYNGGPVEGGTFPAIIWHAFMVQALQILAQEQAAAKGGQSTTPTVSTLAPATPTTSPGQSPTPTVTAPAATTPATGKNPTAPTHTTTPAPTGNAGTAGNQGGTPGGNNGSGTNNGTTGSTGGSTGGTGLGGGASAGGK
jgi:penicillin-binding protein 1A